VQTTDGSMTHAHCMLDNEGYIHTLRIFNTRYFSTAALVARMRLKDTLYVYGLPASLWKTYLRKVKGAKEDLVNAVMNFRIP